MSRTQLAAVVEIMRAMVSGLIMTLAVVSLNGCASTAGPRQLRMTAGFEPTGAADWSRVLALPAATPVLMTVRGTEPRARWIVHVDDSSLTILDLSDPTVPGSAARALLTMAKDRPESLVALVRGGTFQRENVRIGRDGVFVGSRQVARFDQVIESIARGTVLEIRGPVVARGSVLGGVVGAWLGFSVGVVPGLGGAPVGAAWAALVGSTAMGGFLGSHWSSHKVEGLIYRAPHEATGTGAAFGKMTGPAGQRIGVHERELHVETDNSAPDAR